MSTPTPHDPPPPAGGPAPGAAPVPVPVPARQRTPRRTSSDLRAAPAHRWVRWPAGAPGGIGYGADYNPEQWPREVWQQDVALMREAGVTVVSLAIFSWARLQPAPERWDFAWLDEVVDLLHAHGVAVDLATATASPPPWLTTAHPEVLPVDADGRVLHPGGRQHWRPTSAVFRQHALALVEQLARRYGDHPALAAWHVSNELGCHNAHDHSEDAQRAFRVWLQQRYGDLDALNDAWGTAFWSQHVTAWDQVGTPRRAAAQVGPTQQLDFRRFCSDALVEHLRAERAVLRRLTPDVPVTTNFMVMGSQDVADCAGWASEVDFVANDHYVDASLDPRRARDELSFSANLVRGMAGGAPWFLMEHSTSAVNWQPVNRAKAPGAMARDSLTHVAHGADAVCFFQWRQSTAGAEKWHSAMVPHVGSDSDVFREVVELGARLRELAALAGSRVEAARVAVLVDQDSWWAVEADSHPSALLRYREQALDWYTACLDAGVRADVLPASADSSSYDVVVAPVLHVVPDALAARLAQVVADGHHLVLTFASGVVDGDDHVAPGGYPGAGGGVLRELLGLRVQQVCPLLADQQVRVVGAGVDAVARVWTEHVDVTGAEVLARYQDGPRAGGAAVTRRTAAGGGSATYVSASVGPGGSGQVLRGVLRAAGVEPEVPQELGGRVEMVHRRGPTGRWAFVVNRTDEEVDLQPLQLRDPQRRAVLAPREVVVVAESTG